MRISIASYSFHGLLARGMIDVFGYLEACKYRYHANTADIWNGMLVSTDENYILKVKEALDERGLTLANLCVDGASVWDANPEARERQYRHALANLRAAELLGAQTVRIDMGGGQSDMTDEQFDYTASKFSEYAAFADARGFRVGPENHYGPALIPDNLIRLAEAVNHPAFGMLLHLGHWDADGDRGDAMVAKWAVHTHVDADITAHRLNEGLTTLLDAGYQGCWGVEHHSGTDEYTKVEWQLASVRRAVRQIERDRSSAPNAGPAAH
jgi:sugar phosphate isomerase/epimerase